MKTEISTLTVYFPNYNHAQFLPEALDSIFAQSLRPTEVIVVDDASTDNSIEILESYARRYPQLKILRNETNIGAVASLNRGLKAATSEYVYATASDDKVLPGFFEKSMELLAKHPMAGLCCSYPSTMNDLGEIDPRPWHWSFTPCYYSPRQFSEVLNGGFISGHTTIARRDACLEAGGYLEDLKWHCDWFLWLLVAFRHGVCFLPESLAALRVSEDSYSATGMNAWSDQRAVIGRLLDMLQQPDVRPLLPFFVRASVMSHLGDGIVRVVMSDPKYWTAENMMIIHEPLLKRAQSLPHPNGALDITLLDEEDSTTARKSGLPTLSVILPNYNQAVLLRGALENLLAETYQPLEIIVVDDGSTDDSAQVVEEISRNYKTVRLIRNDRNIGVAAAFDRGLQEAVGDYIYGATSDDRIERGFFDKSMRMLARNPKAGFCAADVTMVNAQTGVETPRESKICEKAVYMTPDELLEIMSGYPFGHCPFHSPAVIYNRQAVLDAGGFRSELKWSSDMFVFYVLGFRRGYCYIPERLARVMDDSQSYSGAGQRDAGEQQKILIRIMDLVTTEEFADVGEYFKKGSTIPVEPNEILSVVMRDPKYFPFLSTRLAASVPRPMLELENPQSAARQAFTFVAICQRTLDQKQYAVAVEQYKQAVQLFPGLVDGYLGLAMAAAECRNMSALHLALENLLHLAPYNLDTTQNVGALYYAAGEKRRAKAVFEKILKVAPHRKDTLTQAAQIALDDGKPTDAINYFKQGLLAAPSDTELLFNYAKVAASIHKVDEARHMLGRILEIEPGRIDVIHCLQNLPVQAAAAAAV